MNIRQYNVSETNEITQLYLNTFTDSDGKVEGESVGKLSLELLKTTESKDLLCFVVEENQTLVGSVVFTKMSVGEDKVVYLLSPMAIKSSHQKRGLGQKLINFGLNELKALGTDIVVTYGDPDYYSKVGFSQVSEDVIPAPCKLTFPHGWLAQSLTCESMQKVTGPTTCVAAFNDASYW